MNEASEQRGAYNLEEDHCNEVKNSSTKFTSDKMIARTMHKCWANCICIHYLYLHRDVFHVSRKY